MKEDYTILKTGRHELTRVTINEILYLKAFGNYTDIILESNKKITVCQNIKNILNYINSSILIRISRNSAINKTKAIKVINGKKKIIRLTNNEELNYSTNYISTPNDLLA